MLLKRILGLEFEDLVYLKKQERLVESLNDSMATHQQNEYENKIKNWNYADTQLYNHFNHTLWQKLRQEFGSDLVQLEKEKIILQGKIQSVKMTCLQGRSADDNLAKQRGSFRPKGVKIYEDILRNDLDASTQEYCQGLIDSPLKFLEKIRNLMQVKFS